MRGLWLIPRETLRALGRGTTVAESSMVAAMSVTGIYVDEDTLLDEEPSEHGRQRIPHVALPRFGRVCRTLTNLTLALSPAVPDS